MSAKILIIAAIAAVNAIRLEDNKDPNSFQSLMEVAKSQLKPGEEDSLTMDDYDQKSLDTLYSKAPKENENLQLRFVDEAERMVDNAGIEDSSNVQLMFNVNNRMMVQLANRLQWDDESIPKFGNELDMDDGEENLQAYGEGFDFSKARGENL